MKKVQKHKEEAQEKQNQNTETEQKEQEIQDAQNEQKTEIISETETSEEEENSQKNQTESAEESIEDKYQALNEKYLRLAAEYDNYRKRTLKEKMDLIKNAGEDILTNFLPIIDNLDRAKKSIDQTTEIDAMKEGIALIHKNLMDFIKSRGVKEIEALGNEFDTDLHEALTKIPAPEKKLKGKVVDVIEKGYKLNDKVIRYAKVVVGE